MSNTEHPDVPDRVKLDMKLDATALQDDVRTLVSKINRPAYTYYEVLPLRGPNGPPKVKPGVTDFSDPSLYEWADFDHLRHCQYIQSLLKQFPTSITNVRLMRLEAGAEVKEHRDPTLDDRFRSVIRLTAPIFSDENVTFLLNGNAVPMQPGELWYLRLSDPHSVHNNSRNERINLSIDVVYNQWVEDLLRSGADSH